MGRFLAWGILLILNNVFGTLTSRARNTPSYTYHGITACLNHGAWFLTNVIFIGVAIDITVEGRSGLLRGLLVWLYYTTCATAGSISAHYLSMHHFEKGIRK